MHTFPIKSNNQLEIKVNQFYVILFKNQLDTNDLSQLLNCIQTAIKEISLAGRKAEIAKL